LILEEPRPEEAHLRIQAITTSTGRTMRDLKREIKSSEINSPKTILRRNCSASTDENK